MCPKASVRHWAPAVRKVRVTSGSPGRLDQVEPSANTMRKVMSVLAAMRSRNLRRRFVIFLLARRARILKEKF